MITSDNPGVVFDALKAARKDFPELRKDSEAHYGKFVSFNAIRAEIDPILEKHKLTIYQLPDTVEGHPALTTILRHDDGEYVGAVTPLALTKQDPQAQGSAITYMKRYSYNTVLSLKNLDEDDDGDVATLPDKQVKGNAKGDPRSVVQQRTELEAAAKSKGWTLGKLAKWYHDSFGKDYKRDNDEQNLAKALASVILKDDQ